MGLEITRTYGRIGIETTPAKVDITTNNARLELHSEKASIEIHTEHPRVEISSRECRNTSGMKDVEAFRRDAVQLGYQAASKFISKVSGDGDSYAAIENKTDPMPSIVERDAFPVHEFNIDYMPKAKPEITVKGGVKINAINALGGINNGVKGDYTPGSVNISVTPHKVEIYLTQKPSLDIKYVGKNVDVYK